LAVDRKETPVSDSYPGAAKGELPGAPLGRRLWAYGDQRRLFPHRRPLQLTPRTPVLGGWRVTPWPANGWLGRGVLIAGRAMIPWVFILTCSLPPAIRAAHWPAAWAELDALEAAGLIATGVALIRRNSWLCLPAAVTSTLLVIDAWFDITTSAPGPAATIAIAMAVSPELPMAGLCAVLAIRHAPGCTLCQRHEPPREHLTLLATGERYGSELAAELEARGQIIASEGMLYPLLTRLRRYDLIQTSWQESDAGPPRRYHHLTKDGELALGSFNKQWLALGDAGDEVLSERSQQ
jgi:DNA-binding PadR family transcriptional regulator